ncbi:hypothetical protein GOODEAATRI_029919 [Goodea atripinnis]|uniref:Uncharacterized protein n=1 Tax=Goodea atripinnis TaxID=208336 RepID=A0ABV0MLX1_9TELE
MRAEGNRKVLQMIRVLMLLRCLVHVLLHGSVQLLHDTHTLIISQPPCSCSSSRIYSDHLYISIRSIQMISSHSAKGSLDVSTLRIDQCCLIGPWIRRSEGTSEDPAAVLGSPAAAEEPEPMKSSLGSGSKAAALSPSPT